MSQIPEKILSTIKERRIEPTARWRFGARNLAAWAAAVLGVLAGALAVATILFLLGDQDLDLYAYLGESPLAYALSILPYLWIGITVLSLAAALFYFMRTRHGYRFRVLAVAFGVVLSAALAGGALFAARAGERVHEALSERVPFYRAIVPSGEVTWSQPHRGLLLGTVVTKVSDAEFVVQDVKGVFWRVEAPMPRLRDGIVPGRGMRVKLIGVAYGENEFSADEIRPWNGPPARRVK